VVGLRLPNTGLYQALLQSQAGGHRGLQGTGITLVGDALAPGAIAHAVHSGHGFARGLLDGDAGLYRRDEPITLADPQPVVILNPATGS